MPGISTTGLPATLFLAGPTGSGKSAVAVELAEMLGAEIVGSDAYQVYRELPILTAAPSPEDRARVPHHMVSIIPARMPWDATEHYHRAMRCVEDIHARGKTAIVTGLARRKADKECTARALKRRKNRLMMASMGMEDSFPGTSAR